MNAGLLDDPGYEDFKAEWEMMNGMKREKVSLSKIEESSPCSSSDSGLGECSSTSLAKEMDLD